MKDDSKFSSFITLKPFDNQRLANLCGPIDRYLRQIERHMGIEINNHGHRFHISGERSAVQNAEKLIQTMYLSTTVERPLSTEQVYLFLRNIPASDLEENRQYPPVQIKIPRGGTIHGRNPNQQHYLQAIQEYDINFGIGPAGTGKTYLAVSCAVAALEAGRIHKLVLVRPAVEAGERLGFLPGDMTQKIDPYLRPLYDALYAMLGFEQVTKYIECNMIEIAPLAFMRGRTLQDSFVILDEAQNTTIEQMKMFLTRIGFHSKLIITGDITQIDLPPDKKSGLKHIIHVLENEPDISFTFFTAQDVIRHPLVTRILNAYEKHEKNTSKRRAT